MFRTITALLFGFIVLGIGVGYAGNSLYLAAIGTTTTGTVVGWTKDHASPDLLLTSRSSSRHYPQIQFKTARGQLITFTDNHSERYPSAKGTQVSVRYNPANPRHAEIASGVSVWFVPIGAFVVSLGCIFQGLASIRRL